MKLSDLPFAERLIELHDGNDFALYEHQIRAIDVIQDGRSLILSVPTAAGKTLIGYFAILRNALNGGKALYVVPLKALAAEKYQELRKLSHHGLKVGMAIGDYDQSPDLIKKYDVLVCTSEKADSFFHHDPSAFFDISLIVADEMHLIGDPGRGPRLEMFLTAARFINPDVQIIGLSATITNLEEISSWIGAVPVFSDFRPVSLIKGILYRGKLYLDNDETVPIAKYDELGSLCRWIINSGGQALIFVNSRKRSEDVARKLAISLGLESGTEYPQDDGSNRYHRMVMEMARKRVSFHHAGLSYEDRVMVEDGFRRGDIKVIVATPTLAAGVNLPARLVVIRDITRFSDGSVDYISTTEVNQMLGRAGRPRYDKVGYGVIYASSPTSYEMAQSYLSSDPEPISSWIGSDPNIRFNSLALVSTGLAREPDGILEFLSRTLLGKQKEIEEFRKSVENAFSFLLQKSLISMRNGRAEATQFGRMVSDLYIDPVSAVILRDHLEKNSASEIEALYAISRCPDMTPLNLRKDDFEIVEYLSGKIGVEANDEGEMSYLKTAGMLLDWINEVDLDSICDRYGIGPGDLQSRVSSAEWLCHSLSRIATIYRKEHTRFYEMLTFRISEGVKEEVWELTAIPNIGRVRARRLFNAGFKNVSAVSSALPRDLARIPGFSDKLASDTIDNAKTVLRRMEAWRST
ncbi:MAG: DEAD/DEAH box helicase [Thermoplasmataceae archaeon]